MGYKYTTRSETITVGTSDETMADKINNLVTGIQRFIWNSLNTEAPYTVSYIVENSSTQLRGISFPGTNDNVRLVILPTSNSATPSKGCDATIYALPKNVNGSFTDPGNWPIVDSSSSSYFSILYNSAGKGIYIKEHKFTNSQSGEKSFSVYEIKPSINGTVSDTYFATFGVIPTSDYFTGNSSELFLKKPYLHGGETFYYAPGKFLTLYSYVTGGDIYPSGNYALASGYYFVNTNNSNFMSDFYRVAVDDSTLYRIVINGSAPGYTMGASIKISGSEFISIGSNMYIRIS